MMSEGGSGGPRDLTDFYEGWAAERAGSAAIQEYESLASAWKWEHLSAAIAELGETAPASILEFGCGSGEMLERAAGAFPNARLIGVDLSERMVARAKERLPHATFRVGDERALHEHAGRADLVLAVDILEHLSEPLIAVRALARAGRRVALKIPLERRVIRLGLKPQRPGPEHHVAGHLHFWTLAESRDLVERGGLTILSERCADPPEEIRYHEGTRGPAAKAPAGAIAVLRQAHQALEETLERWTCARHPGLHRLMFGSSHFVVARPADL